MQYTRSGLPEQKLPYCTGTSGRLQQMPHPDFSAKASIKIHRKRKTIVICKQRQTFPSTATTDACCADILLIKKNGEKKELQGASPRDKHTTALTLGQ